MLKIISIVISILTLNACGDLQSPDTSSSLAAGSFINAGRFTINPAVLQPLPFPQPLPAQACAAPILAPEYAAAERKIFELTNAERVRNGLRPLILDFCISQIARAHAQTMANDNNMSHVIAGNGPIERMKNAGIPFLAVYENIHNWVASSNGQAVWDTASYPNQALGFWTTSPTHRANLLNPDVTHIGIGVGAVRLGNQGMLTSTQNFIRR